MIYRDAPTGLPLDFQKAYVPDMPARTAPITAYLSDDNSDGIYRAPVAPGQPNFDTDKGVTS